ncbi:hypothetical protein BAUCODRAFT_24585 [Baudoinia panamericana UAMH 10762]|uniref:2EXR domain-containing protein n=1 Tax=Baudoinia panamericana (strain UAMH 10762) TaxID=717646 RepID=M2LMJ8_BAUPA|nr:uncharacterized protein BAUCODRAFT_24585 [Baudoinia panamericana UAMH 10762]EMC95537.1 hypothetical protein BAUCODRAFT_24585 [Baudoinia panamericana UAMH 10762]
MASSTGSRLLDLPYELRERIFHAALQQSGTIELQYPLWAGRSTFIQPLFHVCRSLRDEVVQAFYQTNVFLWVIDSAAPRGDPSEYPEADDDPHQQWRLNPESVLGPGEQALTRPVPWLYPHLRQHLRRLHVNVYLPSNLIGDLVACQHWQHDFPQALEKLVSYLDRGERLKELQILFTAPKRFNTRFPLAGEQVKALEILAQMRVRGSIRVLYKWGFKEVQESIEALRLEQRISGRDDVQQRRLQV